MIVLEWKIAYEAVIKGSLALMLSHGQRPRKHLGHHIAIIEFAQKNLPGCPAGTFVLLDRMRNDACYDIALVSDTEAQAVAAVDAYLHLVEADLKLRVP